MSSYPSHDAEDGRGENKAKAQASSASRPKKILVVEDERVTRMVISAILTTAGYTVVTAKDAGTALRVIRTDPPDLITLDIDLSLEATDHAWDGFRVVEWLQHLDPHEEVAPFIIISALNPAAIKQRAGTLRAFGYLPKPVYREKLLEIVRQAIGEPPPPSARSRTSAPPLPPTQ
jgi:CheY-like chemotaxis protein